MTTQYDSMFESYERKYGLPVGMLKTIASIESDFNPRAMGKKTKYGHALGMYQILPSTAADYGLTDANDLYDPEKASDIAAQHLARLYKKYDGDMDLTRAAYNAGEGNVEKYGGIPPFDETQKYVERGRQRHGTPVPTTGPTPPIQSMESAPATPVQQGVNAPSTLDRLLQRIFPATEIPKAAVGQATAAPPDAAYQLPAQVRASMKSSAPATKLPPQIMASMKRGGAVTGSPLDPAVINQKIQQGQMPAMTGPRNLGRAAAGSEIPWLDRFNPGPFDNPEETFQGHYPAKVVKVQDGDTVDVRFANGIEERIRLHDVNTAETRDASGQMARMILHNLVPAGENVVVETNGERDPHGRIVGRVVYKDDQGRNIDLAYPVDPRDKRKYPGTHPILGTEGDIGPIKGAITTPPIMMLNEIPEAINAVGRLMTKKEVEYELLENNPAVKLLDGWEQAGYRHWATYLASGYDVDDTTVDIPILGTVTLGEVGRGLWSFIPYMIGISGAAGRTIKLAESSYMGAKAAAIGMEKVSKLMRAKQLSRVDNSMLQAVKAGDETIEGYRRWQDSLKWIEETASEYMVTIEPSATPRTAMAMLSDMRKGFIAHWSNKYNPMMDLVNKIDPERAPEMKALVQRVLGSHDIAQAGIMGGGRISMKKNLDGTYSFGRRGKDLTQVLRGLDEVSANHVSIFSAAARLTGDLLPQWNAWQKAIKKTGGNVQAAKEYLKIKHIPIEVDPKVAAEMKQIQKEIRALYDSAAIIDPQFTGGFDEVMAPRIKAFNRWFDDNAIEPLVEVGAIGKYDVAKMHAKGSHYTPFHRIVLEGLEEIAGPEAVAEIMRIEKQLASKLVEQARGKHVSELSVGVRPIASLHKALGKDWDNMILDPIQTAMTRIPSINKWAEAQRVRNMAGEMVEFAMEMGSDLARGFIKITDPDDIKKIQNARDGNGWIRYHQEPVINPKTGKQVMEKIGDKPVGVRGKRGQFERGWEGGDWVGVTKTVKTGYLTTDPQFAEALRSMSSTHMSLFQQLLKTPGWKWMAAPTKAFRTGTVLGFEFMVRNPVRDQMMAAVMSRFGYIPVLSFWRGMFDVLGKTNVYKEYYNSGAAQANWVNQDFEHVAKRIQDLIGDEPLMEKVQRLITEEHMSYPQALKTVMGEGAGKNIRASRRIAKRAAHDSPLTGIRTDKGARYIAHDIWQATKGGAKSTLYSLRRFSELMEEATRVGGVGKAMRRAKKGKGVTWARSWDDSMGGARGWMEFMAGKHKKSFSEIRANARTARHTPANWMELLDEGRELTLDFARRGSTGEILNSMYPFFNAELQDVSRFYRAMNDAPMTTIMRAFTYITIPAIANWYRNYDDPAYQAQQEIEKDLFIHPFGQDEASGKFKRIPRPIGTVNEMFGIIPTKVLDWLAKNSPDAIKTMEDMLWPGDNARILREKFLEQPYKFADQIPDTIKQAIAVGSMGYLRAPGDPNLDSRMAPGEGGNPLSQSIYGTELDTAGKMKELGKHVLGHVADYVTTNTPGRMINPRNLPPQAVAPMMNVQWNEDPFFKSSIVPQHMYGQHAMVPEETKTEATSPIEELMSGILRTLPGVGVNPIQMGYLIRRYAGSVGHMVMSGADQALQATGAIERRPGVPMDVTNAPFTKAFYGPEPWGSNSQPVQTFYEEWGEGRKRLNTLTMHKKNMDQDAAREFLRKHPETFPDYILERGSEDISEMWGYRRQVRSSKYRPDGSLMAPEIRLDMLNTIDKAITAHAYLILEEYYKLRKDPTYMDSILGRMIGD